MNREAVEATEFNSFTFNLTDDCNYDCTYCQHKKAQNYLKHTHIDIALNHFYPFLSEECYINFYGGEPLLAFPAIKYIIESLKQKNQSQKKIFLYTISTNGSLLDKDVIQFFIQHDISPLLSFDGLAQDITRKKGTFGNIVELIENILVSDIELYVNSVFTPETIKHLSESMQLLLDMDVKNIDLSLSTVTPWDASALEQLKAELINLRKNLYSFYKRTKKIPINKFSGKHKKGVFVCAAGRDRMTLAPDGKLWGCHLFPLYFDGKENSREYQKYCFGDVDLFKENFDQIYPQILKNYAELRMDFFYTKNKFCLFCGDLEECGVCPVYAALASGTLKKIPPWICEIKKIFREEKKKLRKALDLESGEGDSVSQ